MLSAIIVICWLPKLNPFRGKPTFMSPKVKGYTDINVILTYTGTETHMSFGLFIPEIHFFGQGLKFFLPPKGLKLQPNETVFLALC